MRCAPHVLCAPVTAERDNAGMDGRPAAAAEPGVAGARADAGRRQNTAVALGASLLGAIVTFLYFRYLRRRRPQRSPARPRGAHLLRRGVCPAGRDRALPQQPVAPSPLSPSRGSHLADRRTRPPARPALALCHRAGDLHRMGHGGNRLGHPLAAHGRDLHGGKGASLALRHLGDRRRARHGLRLPGHRASVAAGAAPLLPGRRPEPRARRAPPRRARAASGRLPARRRAPRLAPRAHRLHPDHGHARGQPRRGGAPHP